MNPDPQAIVDRLKQAQEAFLSGEYRQALEHYRWVEANLGEDRDALPLIWMEMGWCHYFLQNYTAAIERFSRVLERRERLTEQQIFDALRLVGFSHKSTGNPDRAIAFLQDAVARPIPDAEKRHAWFELGRLFFTQDLAAEAGPYLEQALANFAEEEGDYRQSARYYLGFVRLLSGDHRAAEDLFEAILGEAPNATEQAPGHFGLAHLRYADRDYRSVVAQCREVMSADPDFFDRETVAFFLCRPLARSAITRICDGGR